MESVIKQLVKIGHGMGAEVANDEPAVAKLLVELSSALDVQYERANALEAKCAELAAENAGLKKYICDECYVENIKTGATKCAGHGMPETPATDSFLAEVRAQGVEMLTTKLQQLIDEGNFEGDEVGLIAGAVYTGADIAAQLRKGASA